MAPLIAWLGGGAFAASLGYLVYFYLDTLGAAAADAGTLVGHALVDIALFVGFAGHHSVLARTGLKRRVIALVGPRYERTLYVWTSSLLLLAVCLFWRSIPGVVYQAEGAARWLLHAAQALGALLTLRAARVIDVLELAGIRQARGELSTGELQIVGPFRMVRHPIYLGWILMVFAAPTMTANRLLFATISSAYLILAIPWEERSLAAAHGDRYRAYRTAVRWRVFPGVW